MCVSLGTPRIGAVTLGHTLTVSFCKKLPHYLPLLPSTCVTQSLQAAPAFAMVTTTFGRSGRFAAMSYCSFNLYFSNDQGHWASFRGPSVISTPSVVRGLLMYFTHLLTSVCLTWIWGFCAYCKHESFVRCAICKFSSRTVARLGTLFTGSSAQQSS